MAYWNKDISGFEPYQNKEGTLPEYTDEQIEEMFFRGNVIVGEDGLPIVVSRPEVTVADTQSNYERRVDDLIRSKYTLSQELSILRQREIKRD